MVGVLLISHYTLAESLKETVSLIIGKKENLDILALMKDDKIEDFTEKLKKKVSELDEGDGVLIMADMFGGTPSNASLAAYAEDDRVAIITGFNLPLVIEAVMHSGKPLTELNSMLMEKREKTIIDTKEMFKNRR